MGRSHGRVRGLVTLVGVGLMVLPATGAFAQGPPADDGGAYAATVPFALVDDRDLDERLPQPEDRYAMASGCYTLEAPGEGHVARTADGLVVTDDPAAAEPLHFQATQLGQYLLATNEGPDTTHEGAWWDVRGYVAADARPLLGGDAVTVADAPSESADWQVVAAGDDPEARAKGRNGQGYVLSLPSEGRALGVVAGALALVDGDGTVFRLHHVADDDPTDDDPNGTACATWPEVTTNTSGAPTPPRGNPAGEVEGFFDAHIHGMAFEFLGGELRCGRPWHPYGVEYALPDCREDGKVLNPVAEVVLAGATPEDYDPVGWPTFETWPDHDLLTHEQWYWKWLERSYHGGLRLMTNLLVENTALCQLYPQKRNSCNEMDSVRLQADRLFEMQDYIDAQSGGPGEGWFRIVTSPAQARRVINDGRMAVVIGIEVSVLFDCGEVLGEPQCTTEEIDRRVQEVHDMGVRQVELINKFDNALSGVAGDAGSTGVIVNQGNRLVTGHYWDMRTCPPEADDGHDHGIEGTQYDKTQMNPSDDTPLGDAGGDVLAAAIVDTFGDLTSVAAPVYPAGPHCNEAGLTDLGAHAVRRIIEKGIMFDPDHMSAAGQREALDLVEDELVPDRRADGARGPAIHPGLVSSHSWANDVTYQRILHLGGHVAPMQSDAASFADRWAQRRQWATDLAPEGVEFGMGFGADTNGFASQPGPRPDPATPLAYDGGFEAPIGDVTLYQQVSGLRSFDVNIDGIAHYGLYADWFRELQLAADEQHGDLGGGDQLLADMLRGSEHYLSMWERAVYGATTCVEDGSAFQPEDLHALVGTNLEGFLRAVGQPVDRDGAAYTYCVEDEDGTTSPVDVVFDAVGEVIGVRPNPGTVEPDPAPAPPEDDAPRPAPANDDGHDHAHGAPVASGSDGAGTPPLPATGGGAARGALVLLGATMIGWSGLWRRRE